MEIVDPAHPLFGRRFRLASPPGPIHPSAQIRLIFGSELVLTIPAAATDLLPPPPQMCAAPKLSVEALRDLLTVAGEAVAPCPSSPVRSGAASPHGCVGRSPTTSPQRSGR